MLTSGMDAMFAEACVKVILIWAITRARTHLARSSEFLATEFVQGMFPVEPPLRAFAGITQKRQ